MKTLRQLFYIAVSVPGILANSAAIAIVAGQVDDFEDMDPVGWGTFAEPDAQPVTALCPPDFLTYCLKNETTGTAELPKRQIVLNQAQWAGNYLTAEVSGIEVELHNEGPGPVHLRIGVTNGNGRMPASCFVSADAVVIGAEETQTVRFDLLRSAMSRVRFGVACNPLSEDELGAVLQNVEELRLFSAETVTWTPDEFPSDIYYDRIEARSDFCLDRTVSLNLFDLCGTPRSGATLTLTNDELGYSSGTLSPVADHTFTIDEPPRSYLATAVVPTACDEATDSVAVADSCADAELAVAVVKDHVWPLTGSCSSDPMTTSFGPRINSGAWNFHDGIDLPAAIGSDVHAVHDGSIAAIFPPAPDASARVVVTSCDPARGDLFVNYIHVVTDGLVTGSLVEQGVAFTQTIDPALDDNASWPHLHLEIREGDDGQAASMHPLGYLEYTDTQNFSLGFPGTATPEIRYNFANGKFTARIPFGAADRNEGDFLAASVDLVCAGAVRSTNMNLNDKSTLNDALNPIVGPQNTGDAFIYSPATTDGLRIGIEGYQRSNMTPEAGGDAFADLHYAILVRGIDADCTELSAALTDVSGNVTTLPAVLLPVRPSSFSQHLDFEPDAPPGCGTTVFPPDGWAILSSSGTAVAAGAVGSPSSTCGMVSLDSSTAMNLQTAAISLPLPDLDGSPDSDPGDDRFEWAVRGWFNPVSLSLSTGQNVYPVYFLRDAAAGESTAALRIRQLVGGAFAGVFAEDSDDTRLGVTSDAANAEILTGGWRRWALHLLRVGTRKTTAVLYLDSAGDDALLESARLAYDGISRQPQSVRVGLGLSSRGATARMHTDDVTISEDPCEVLPFVSDYDCS